MIKMQKILCPVDFSECSDHALQYAIALAQTFKAELHLIYVLEPVTYGPATGATTITGATPATGATTATGGLGGLGGGLDGLGAEFLEEVRISSTNALTDLAKRARKQHAPIVERIMIGTSFVEIVKYARDQDVDLIVMGTHGRTGLPHVLIGSCAERVVRKAPCPVLTVKHPSHDFVMP